MLTINLKQALIEKGYDSPTGFLVKNGFRYTVAHRLVYGNNQVLKLKSLEKICAVLKCTPNDLLEWAPDSKDPLPDDHPLQKLKPKQSAKPLSAELRNLSFEKIQQVRAFIQELKQ